MQTVKGPSHVGDAALVREVSELGQPCRTRDRMAVLAVLLAAVDAVVLAVAVVLANEGRWALSLVTSDAAPVDPLAPAAGPWVILTWISALVLHRAYTRRVLGEGAEEFRAVARSSVVAAGVVGLACYLLQFELSRGFLLLVFALGTPMLLASRLLSRAVLHRVRSRGHLVHRVIVVGGPSGVNEVVDALIRRPQAGFEVVGACLPDGAAGGEIAVPVLGGAGQLRALCDLVGADTVLVARGGYDSAHALRRIAWQLQGSDYDLIVVPSLTDVAGPRISMRPVAGLPLLHVAEPQSDGASRLPKRLFDVIVTTLALLVLAPVLLTVALGVKLHDGGPVLFRQQRVGQGGRRFAMLKFRSMVTDAEALKADLAELNAIDDVLFKIPDDPRITPLGRVLRRFSLDELPQLVNVLRGEMSLVGPRPPLPDEVDHYAPDVHRRLLVRPGVTGLWQVSGRSTLSWRESVRLDLYYVDNWSLSGDLAIMAKTLRAVVGSSGAY